MKRWMFASAIIASMGYDALCAVLEVEYRMDTTVCQYKGVPETVWYALKETDSPEKYLNRYVVGKYEESNLSEG